MWTNTEGREYNKLLAATLQYIQALALSPTYKRKIQSALNKVLSAGTGTGDGEGSTAQRIIEEYSCLYRDLADQTQLELSNTSSVCFCVTSA